AQLRRPGDRAVALAERREVALDQSLGRARGAVEALARGALEVARQRALLDDERKGGRAGGDTCEDQEQAGRDGEAGAPPRRPPPDGGPAAGGPAIRGPRSRRSPLHRPAADGA